MKRITYLSNVLYLGERCRLLIVCDIIYVALSRERKRINVDITLKS